MSYKKFHGIKFPFLREDKHLTYLDLNETYDDSIKSKILHIMFTPKGQKLRDPEFGSDLIKYIFEPNDDTTMDNIIKDIRGSILKYLPNVTFNDVRIYSDEENEHSHVVICDYTVKEGNQEYTTNFGIKI